jgi:hypothetical protein
VPDSEAHSSRNTKRSENEAEGPFSSRAARDVGFNEMAFMFPAFHDTVQSSGLATDGLGAITGRVIPGVARQEKKKTETKTKTAERAAHIPHATSCESNMN